MSELEKKPSHDEDEWAAREDQERLKRLAFKQSEALAAQEKESLRKLHHMKCPTCGMDMQNVVHGDLSVPTCFHCQAVWLKSGSIERFMDDEKKRQKSGSLLRDFLTLFKRELKP